MEKKRISGFMILPVVLLVVLIFLLGLNNLRSGQRSEGRKQLEDAVRRAAVACYATEGIYPPDLEYLEEHYGIQAEQEGYTIIYEVFASNLMPDVTVLEHEP